VHRSSAESTEEYEQDKQGSKKDTPIDTEAIRAASRHADGSMKRPTLGKKYGKLRIFYSLLCLSYLEVRGKKTPNDRTRPNEWRSNSNADAEPCSDPAVDRLLALLLRNDLLLRRGVRLRAERNDQLQRNRTQARRLQVTVPEPASAASGRRLRSEKRVGRCQSQALPESRTERSRAIATCEPCRKRRFATRQRSPCTVHRCLLLRLTSRKNAKLSSHLPQHKPCPQ